MQNKTNQQMQLAKYLQYIFLSCSYTKHGMSLNFLWFLSVVLSACFPCFPVCFPAWQACSKVCAYVRRQVEHVRKSMDGKNVDTVLTELGVRFHRLIHEHLQQYSYSSMGGMLAICDVAEYRRCAKDFRVSRGA